MKQYMVFDIGGTDIKYGIINENYELTFHDKMPTQAHRGGRSIIERLIQKTLEFPNTFSGVAISSAGIINPINGEVIYATDAIPNYIGVNIKEMVEKETGLPCEVLNDVKCFALCEHTLGSAQGANDFITLTVGTGIGGAIVTNGELVYGKDFSAGEWGRTIVNGQKFEAVGSMTGLIQLANEKIYPHEWDGIQIFELYDQQHPGAVAAVNEFYQQLATGITNLIYIFNPEKVVIGGGITARKEKFLNELKEAIQAIIEPRFFELTEIVLAKYKNTSGLIGAFIHFKNQQQRRKESN